jgi:hypothetical protein
MMPVTTAERRFILDSLVGLAEEDIRKLWKAAETMQTDVAFAAYIAQAFPQIVDPYYQLAAEASATFYGMDHPREGYTPVTAPLPPREKLIMSAKWALAGDGVEAIDRMSGSAQRAIYDGDRLTTALNADNNNQRYVRVARANACAFCRMLASRSASGDIDLTYKSEKSATTVVGDERGRPRGKRAIGELYHDFCYCIAQAIPDDQHPLDYLELVEPGYAELATQWGDEYDKARANAGNGDTTKILAEWRKQGVA